MDRIHSLPSEIESRQVILPHTRMSHNFRACGFESGNVDTLRFFHGTRPYRALSAKRQGLPILAFFMILSSVPV
jgi:hypothetical protein